MNNIVNDYLLDTLTGSKILVCNIISHLLFKSVYVIGLVLVDGRDFSFTIYFIVLISIITASLWYGIDSCCAWVLATVLVYLILHIFIFVNLQLGEQLVGTIGLATYLFWVNYHHVWVNCLELMAVRIVINSSFKLFEVGESLEGGLAQSSILAHG